jgi:hypothetical protein
MEHCRGLSNVNRAYRFVALLPAQVETKTRLPLLNGEALRGTIRCEDVPLMTASHSNQVPLNMSTTRYASRSLTPREGANDLVGNVPDITQGWFVRRVLEPAIRGISHTVAGHVMRNAFTVG